MPRIPHGSVIPLESFNAMLENFSEVEESSSSASAALPTLTRFGYLFCCLQSDPANLLPKDATTVANLIRLGGTMLDPGTDEPGYDSNIPAAYTYFAQFVDHDITLEAVTKDVALNNQMLEPWALDEVLQKIKNTRTGTLDLDSVYGPAYYEGNYYPVPRNGDKMVIERAVASLPSPDPDDSDLPRESYNDDPDFDRAAKIGDGRNDQNLIISQLHVAFLRAHNAIVSRGNSFDQARKLLRQHYQWIVIGDFLNQIADPAIVEEIRSDTEQVYDPTDDGFFMPLEFTVAAFRFGHSMIRNSYHYNANFENGLKARLYQLFMPPALGLYHHVPADWIIQWDRFLEGGSNVARRIDTRLVNPLSALLDLQGQPMKFETRLAVRDLIRGYVLRMPTGQAVAQALRCPVMSETELEDVAGKVSDNQKQILRDSGFSKRTPLWFYILAEAAHYQKGFRLGPVGSKLVAGVLIGLVRRSEDSILSDPNWAPTLGKTPGRFDLPDLLQLAGVFTPQQ